MTSFYTVMKTFRYLPRETRTPETFLPPPPDRGGHPTAFTGGEGASQWRESTRKSFEIPKSGKIRPWTSAWLKWPRVVSRGSLLGGMMKRLDISKIFQFPDEVLVLTNSYFFDRFVMFFANEPIGWCLVKRTWGWSDQSINIICWWTKSIKIRPTTYIINWDGMNFSPSTFSPNSLPVGVLMQL